MHQFHDAHSGRLYHRSAVFSRSGHHNSGDSPFSSFSFLYYPQQLNLFYIFGYLISQSILYQTANHNSHLNYARDLCNNWLVSVCLANGHQPQAKTLKEPIKVWIFETFCNDCHWMPRTPYAIQPPGSHFHCLLGYQLPLYGRPHSQTNITLLPDNIKKEHWQLS